MKDPNITAASKLAAKATREERKLARQLEDFQLQNKEFAKFLKKQDELQRQITALWDGVKAALVAAEYYDVIENDSFKISVSKVAGIKVVDVNALPEELTETVKVAKVDKIKQQYALHGTLPNGVVDSSYHRLNKKLK